MRTFFHLLFYTVLFAFPKFVPPAPKVGFCFGSFPSATICLRMVFRPLSPPPLPFHHSPINGMLYFFALGLPRVRPLQELNPSPLLNRFLPLAFSFSLPYTTFGVDTKRFMKPGATLLGRVGTLDIPILVFRYGHVPLLPHFRPL